MRSRPFKFEDRSTLTTSSIATRRAGDDPPTDVDASSTMPLNVIPG
jgi:hypothetical protein